MLIFLRVASPFASNQQRMAASVVTPLLALNVVDGLHFGHFNRYVVGVSHCFNLNFSNDK